MVSNTLLLVNKVSFALEQSLNDHTLAGIRTLFRIYNNAGNAVRHLVVANVPKDLGEASPENFSGLKLLESIDKLIKANIMPNESQALVNLSLERNDLDLVDSVPDIDNHYINLIPNGKFEFSEDILDTEKPFTFDPIYHQTRKLAFDLGYEENDWVFDDFSDEDFEDDEEVEWEYYEDNNDFKPDLLKIDEGHEVINEDDKLLIMATGIKVCIPHMIGIKRMSQIRFRKNMDFSKSLAQRDLERRMDQRRARRQRQNTDPAVLEAGITDWHDYKAVKNKFDGLDYLIEMHGRIVGMALSPCHRYLYINVRPWPRNYEDLIKRVSDPPPMGSKIDRYILDLGRMSFVGQQIHTQTAFVASDVTLKNFTLPCVTKHLLGSGQESGSKAGLWDRHHGVQVCQFQGKDVINSVAVSVDESVAVTVSDDMQVLLWRSKYAASKN